MNSFLILEGGGGGLLAYDSKYRSQKERRINSVRKAKHSCMIKTKCCEGRRTGKLVKNTLFSSQRPGLPNIYVKTSRKSTRFPVLSLAKDMTVQVAASPCIKRNASQSKTVGACLACCPKPVSVSTPPVVRPRRAMCSVALPPATAAASDPLQPQCWASAHRPSSEAKSPPKRQVILRVLVCHNKIH